MNLIKFLDSINKIDMPKRGTEIEVYDIPGTLYFFFIFENSKIKIGESKWHTPESKYLSQYDFKRGLKRINDIIRKAIDP